MNINWLYWPVEFVTIEVSRLQCWLLKLLWAKLVLLVIVPLSYFESLGLVQHLVLHVGV